MTVSSSRLLALPTSHLLIFQVCTFKYKETTIYGLILKIHSAQMPAVVEMFSTVL